MTEVDFHFQPAKGSWSILAGSPIPSDRVLLSYTTKAYMQRRRAEGKSKAEVIRCLKRYVARELYQAFVRPHQQRVDSDAAQTDKLKKGS